MIGFVAIGAAWGLNEVAVWQLEQNMPEPDKSVVRAQPAAPAPAAPEVSAELVVEQGLVEQDLVEQDVVDDLEDRPTIQRADRPSRGNSAKDAEPAKTPAKTPAPPKRPSSSGEPQVRVFGIDTGRLKQKFKRPQDTAGHGQIVPHYKDGERRGLKFAAVAPGGLFGRLGIESGDVILSVNGTKITTQQKALADFEEMRKLRTFDVVLERQGEPRHPRYVLK
jgi:membrane-associated protease RseP (regulator of RpoE activity)